MMMATRDDLERRLVTVLFADVVGYTRLTEVDEAGTHRALKDVLSMASEQVTRHDGRIAHYAGDAMLAHFSSVIDGLNCAVEIQRALSERAESAPAASALRFRIGVNVGDVICDGTEIYGDTVNTAVRLQGIAEPGGICISEAVRNAIGRQLPIAYEFVGEERLKNLSLPVRAYRALLDPGVRDEATPEPGAKPAVAVVPFENLGGEDAEADSLTEDLIRELSRFRGLEVIAHNSTFVYKGTPVKVQQLAHDLGAEYAVEGHVRTTPTGLRVNVQLVCTSTGRHLWSELYERTSDDILHERDAIVRLAVAAIAGRIHVAAGDAARRCASAQLNAFQHVLRGQALVGKGRESNLRARSHYQRALALEPGQARALAGIALSHVDDWWNGSPACGDGTLDRALDVAREAYGADASDSKVHWTLALVHCLRQEVHQAERLVARATALNPNDADAFLVQALVCLSRADARAAGQALSTALLLNPFPAAWYQWARGVSHLALNEPMDARLCLLEALQQNPALNAAKIALIVACSEIGDEAAARDEAAAVRRVYPGATAADLASRIPADSAQRAIMGGTLTKVGL